MFGDPLRNVAAMSANKSPPSLETSKLVEEVLFWIKSNLRNIEAVWGRGSEQYESAASIMEQYIKRNTDLEKDDIEKLMQKMSLEDSSSTSESNKSKS